MPPTDAERLARLIQDNQPCVVLTGAGVSTESGIPDFRSATGIWAQYDPMEYATIDAFRRDPVKVWDFYGRRLGVLETAKPNDAHLALARHLQERGQVARTVTTKLRYPDFSIRTRSTSLPVGTADPQRIGDLACALLDRALRDRPGPLRLVGVGLSGLAGDVQLTLTEFVPNS